jgi:polyisoprenoid-binding protein YceI
MIRIVVGAVLVAAVTSSWAADTLTKYESKLPCKVKIEGTSTIHDWTVESQIISGTMELAELKGVTAGKIPAKVQVLIPVRSLKSGNKLMDDIMYKAMKMQTVKNIQYRLTELVLKEAPRSPGGPFQCDSTGELMVSGVTNIIGMPVTIDVVDNRLKITGSVPLKMTQFGIEPPAPTLALGSIKTGDEVKISFEWMTAPAAK